MPIEDLEILFPTSRTQLQKLPQSESTKLNESSGWTTILDPKYAFFFFLILVLSFLFLSWFFSPAIQHIPVHLAKVENEESIYDLCVPFQHIRRQ